MKDLPRRSIKDLSIALIYMKLIDRFMLRNLNIYSRVKGLMGRMTGDDLFFYFFKEK